MELVSGAHGGYDYAGGFQMATGSLNTYLSNDGMTQKGFMKFITSGMVTSPSANGRWKKTINPLVSTKVTALPNFEEGTENAFFSQRALIVDNPEIFNEATIGDTTYMIYATNAGNITWADQIAITGCAGSLGGVARSQHLHQEREKQEDVIFFDDDLPADLVNSDNLPYLWVSSRQVLV